MFQIKCIVADKRLPEVLRVLEPFVLDPPAITPLDDVALGLGKVKGTSHTGVGEIVNQFITDRVMAGAKTITATELRDHVVSKGYSERSYSYSLSQAVLAKRLKRTKLTGTYEVIR